jgi:hypothetical protein
MVFDTTKKLGPTEKETTLLAVSLKGISYDV